LLAALLVMGTLVMGVGSGAGGVIQIGVDSTANRLVLTIASWNGQRLLATLTVALAPLTAGAAQG